MVNQTKATKVAASKKIATPKKMKSQPKQQKTKEQRNSLRITTTKFGDIVYYEVGVASYHQPEEAYSYLT